MEGLKLKPSEVLILIFAFLLFSGASYIYVTNFPLQKYIFGNRFEQDQEQIGKLTIKAGTIKRKTTNQNSFEPVEANTDLYNYDTLVTGPESTATITLKDGSAIQLSPKTMIKLVFDSRLSLGGISRSRTIDVVAGQVSGESKTDKIILKSKEQTVTITQAKPKEEIKVSLPPIEVITKPKPIPTPVAVATPVETPAEVPTPVTTPAARTPLDLGLISPEQNARLFVKEGSQVAERTVEFSWKVKPENTETRLIVRQLNPGGGTKELFNEKISAIADDARANMTLKRPGNYNWEVQSVNEDEPLPKKLVRNFRLEPTFRGITVLKPVIGNADADADSDETLLKNFGITLRWSEFPDADNYILRLVRNEHDRVPILEKSVSGTKYEFNRDKVFSGEFLYNVRTKLSSGFTVTSTVGRYSYRFKPPVLVRPEPNTLINQQDLDQQENRILFTWRKTQFTEAYLLEFSLEKSFSKIVLNKKTRENFFILKAPPNGTYWWRVRSIATKGMTSEPSAPNQIVVKRTNPNQKSNEFDDL